MSNQSSQNADPTHRSSLIAQHCFLALDLGTTSLVGQLVGADRSILAELSVANPQRTLGADILTRLQRAQEGAGAELQRLLLDGVRELVGKLLLATGLAADRIVAAAAAGNPGITHLLRRLPVEQLLFPPHKPADKQLAGLPPDLADLGLSVPLQVLPAVSGFVGGDLLACLLSLAKPRRGTVCIDIGTNGEMALWDGGRWWVTSAAAGPAFEAANIACGMPMGPGAVTDVHRVGDRLELTVAGGGPPRGLCGSGLAALVAAALEGDLIDAGGRIRAAEELADNLVHYLVDDETGRGVRFYRDARSDLRLGQADVRNFQLAKGAMRAGLEVLLEQAGLNEADVAEVVITGALGTALPVATLKKVALLPVPMIDKTRFIPNAVLTGLTRFLADPDGPQQLRSLLNLVQPFPLSGTPRFERRFLAALEF